MRKDHPRIRGEHGITKVVGWVAGSSPHTRGARHVRASADRAPRIIPAYAGSTYRLASRAPVSPDHPRIRGEHVRLGRQCGDPGRIIPAYAGSTSSIHTKGDVKRDHPRIRGEHSERPGRRARPHGSSPHTRGARRRRPHPDEHRVDHPRIRGEHRVHRQVHGARRGSSPHTRGAHHGVRTDDRSRGIIPAYAGSTPSGMRRRGISRDHPRIRGEHSSRSSANSPASGSSPHTRGAPLSGFLSLARGRIIPAYAGSTNNGVLIGKKPQDHPRIRGEHPARGRGYHEIQGSSPHTRGAPVSCKSLREFCGIIPAYAGSTRLRMAGGRHLPDHPRIRGEHQSFV